MSFFLPRTNDGCDSSLTFSFFHPWLQLPYYCFFAWVPPLFLFLMAYSSTWKYHPLVLQLDHNPYQTNFLWVSVLFTVLQLNIYSFHSSLIFIFKLCSTRSKFIISFHEITIHFFQLAKFFFCFVSFRYYCLNKLIFFFYVLFGSVQFIMQLAG